MAFSMMRSAQSARAVRTAATAGGSKTASGSKTLGGSKPLGGKGTVGTQNSQRQAEVAAYLETLPGITAPFKGVWDPLNLSASANVADIRRWRESEITHGRVAMLAAVGFLVGEQLEDFPLFFNFDGHITGPAIKQFDQVRQGFWEPLLIAIGLLESYRVSLGWETPTGNGFNSLKDDYEMGNLYFDPLGLKPDNEEDLKVMETKELNNGRLAMIAIAGFVLQEVAEPGVEIFEHLFFNVEKDVVEELDVIEKDLGLPQTFPIPTLPAK